MAPPFTLIHTPGLPTRSARIAWLLEELGLPYEVKAVKFNPYDKDSDLSKPEFTEVSPLKALPALKDGDTWLVESGAIAEYILIRYGDGKLTPPKDSEEYGVYLRWLWFSESSLSVWATEYAHHKVLRPDDLKVAEVLPVLKPKVENALATLEANLEGKTYVTGEEFTAADIFLGQTLSVVDGFAGLLTDAYPNTQAYHKRILERPAAKKVYSGEQ